MKICEEIKRELGEGVNTSDGLERLHKKLKGKSKNYFIIGEQVPSDEKTEYQKIASDLRKIDKSIKGLTATTDTEYSNDDGFVDDDGEESSDNNFYAFSMPESDINMEAELKKLDDKYGFYGVWINKKQINI